MHCAEHCAPELHEMALASHSHRMGGYAGLHGADKLNWPAPPVHTRRWYIQRPRRFQKRTDRIRCRRADGARQKAAEAERACVRARGPLAEGARSFSPARTRCIGRIGQSPSPRGGLCLRRPRGAAGPPKDRTGSGPAERAGRGAL